MEFARVTPSLPQRGKQPKGACPLDPSILNYFVTRGSYPVLLHGANPDEAVSARGSIVNSVLNFLQHCYRAIILKN
jgi:hypothetical protein